MKRFEVGSIKGGRGVVIENICKVLYTKGLSSISKVVLFGSVAKGTYTDTSDYDFAVISDVLTDAKLMRSKDFRAVRSAIYEVIGIDSKYECDILFFGTNKRTEGIYQSIEREGVVLYDKEVLFRI